MPRLRSPDGVELAVHELGGEGEPLLLVHGTGFCGQVFEPLATHLRSSFRCWALDLRGHGASSAPHGHDFSWDGFARDVLAAVDGLRLGRPAAVGHSAGGAALLLAEAERPGTFAALWCYEPIVWPDPRAAWPRAAGLAEGARRRRDVFASRPDAYAHFATRPPFSALAPEALQAYVDHGFVETEDGGVTLRCPREVEAAVYLQGVEGDRFGRLPEVTCPTVIACGGRTNALKPDIGARLAAALPDGRLEVLDGLGHFGPLEDPATVATVILSDLAG